MNDHFAINVRGGGEKVQYYVSVNHNRDNGMIKTDKINQFDANIQNQQTTFRSNINANLTKTAKLVLNSFSTYDKYHGTVASTNSLYAFAANPVDFAPTYPVEGTSYNWPHIAFGGSNSSGNPYAEVQKGYQDRIRYSTINNFEFIQNLNDFIKGLEFRATLGVTNTGYFANAYEYAPAYYSLSWYNPINQEHELTPTNESSADETLRKTSGGDAKNSQTIMDYQARLFHTAAWNDHQTSLTGVFTDRQKDDRSPSNIIYSFPARNISFAARGTYGYKDTYFVEASLGINGSERFAKGNRIGYFPAFGAAWVVTQEDFMRSTSRWLSFLKFRGSYGKTGNDGVISSPRFLYLDEFNSDYTIGSGEGLNSSSNYYRITNYGNDQTEWEIAEQVNFGIDLRLFGGMVDITTDIYQETRHNIYSLRTTIPATMGLYTDPLDNVGKVRGRGIDFSGKIQHAFSNDFWFIANGTFTYSKSTILKIEEAVGKPEWQL
ncbi:MAG: hypothetical protein ACK5JS_09905 [Mangrovibacterium sp.]